MKRKYFTLVALGFAFGLLSFGRPGDFDIKSVQKSLVKISDKLYASKFEVSNQEYNRFLESLKRNNRTEAYHKALMDTAQWKNILPDGEIFMANYHRHPAFSIYPAVNIHYEAALLFCDWLTEQYNAAPKRPFQQVKFRLPTEEEWIMAAKGGNPKSVYPWEGNHLRNKRGMYHCNFGRSVDGSGPADGMNDLTAPTKFYIPNGFGLYQMSGNVAEMLLEKGKTKGGSWQDSEEAMKIENDGKYGTYDAPQPTIGFRYFMDVIEA